MFSPFPPAFAAVPQYFVPITVVPLPLSEPDKRISHTSGSSVSHSVGLCPTYPCRVNCHPFSVPCITLMFLLLRPTSRGDLRSAGITRLIARPSRCTGPHHSRRCPSLPSFYIGQGTRGLPCGFIPQELSRRSPGYFSAVARLDAVLDPGAAASHLSLSRSPHGLLPKGGDRPSPKLNGSRGYLSDSELHPSPRRTRYFSFLPFGFLSHFTTGPLTRLYPGRLTCR